jgi:tetratricopeptide (TPR) repeat protein
MEKPSSPRRIIQIEKLITHHLKSLDYLSKGNLEKSQKLLESLSSNNTLEIPALNNLSVTYSKQKNYNKSIGSLLKALAKCKLRACHKEQLGTLINLTVAASNLNIHNEALNYALQAKQLLREEDFEVAGVVFFNLGLELFHMNRFIEAEENFNKILNLQENQFPLNLAVKSLINQCISHQFKEPRPCQVLDNLKRTVKKNNSSQIISIFDRKIEKKEEKVEKKEESQKKVEKVLIHYKQKSAKDLKVKSVRPQKAFRAGSLLSGRQVFQIDRLNGSSTSSTESLPNGSFLRNSLSSSKSLRKMPGSEKSSKQSTPVSQACKILKNDLRIGSFIQNIGDHLNSLERNMNSFAELYKPLKTLTEDPDELLDSNRNVAAQAQKMILSQINRKRIAAIKIQRAFRKFRAAKMDSVEKALIIFKDNPLFKSTLPSIKGKGNKKGSFSASKVK